MAEDNTNNEAEEKVTPKIIDSSTDIDIEDIFSEHKKRIQSDNDFTQTINDAAEELKSVIKDGFMKRVLYAERKRYQFSHHFTWKTGSFNKDIHNEDDQEFFRTFNGKSPFTIINYYKRNEGKYMFLDELSNEFTEQYGKGKASFKFFYREDTRNKDKDSDTNRKYIIKAKTNWINNQEESS